MALAARLLTSVRAAALPVELGERLGRPTRSATLGRTGDHARRFIVGHDPGISRTGDIPDRAPTGARTLDPRINLLHWAFPSHRNHVPACSLDYIFTFGRAGQVRRV